MPELSLAELVEATDGTLLRGAEETRVDAFVILFMALQASYPAPQVSRPDLELVVGGKGPVEQGARHDGSGSGDREGAIDPQSRTAGADQEGGD